MEVKNPEYKQIVKTGFETAAFLNDIGITLIDCGPGWCESSINISPRHLQAGGLIHAGVQATIADHTAGGAATTLLGVDQFVLTVEFKINLLRAAQGESLICRAQVLKPGKIITTVESDVYSMNNTRKTLVSKTIATMNVLSKGH